MAMLVVIYSSRLSFVYGATQPNSVDQASFSRKYDTYNIMFVVAPRIMGESLDARNRDTDRIFMFSFV